MIRRDITTKEILRGMSLKINPTVLDIMDLLVLGVDKSCNQYGIDANTNRADMLRELVDGGIKYNIPILAVEEKVYTVKDLLTLAIGDEIVNINNITELFDREELQDLFVYISMEVMDSIIDRADEITKDDFDEIEDWNSFKKRRREARKCLEDLDDETFIYGDMKEKKVDHTFRVIQEYDELAGEQGLSNGFIFEFEDRLKECNVYKKIQVLYYYYPASYTKLKRQLDILVDKWNYYCMSYGSIILRLKSKYTFDDFITNVEKEIGSKFILPIDNIEI